MNKIIFMAKRTSTNVLEFSLTSDKRNILKSPLLRYLPVSSSYLFKKDVFSHAINIIDYSILNEDELFFINIDGFLTDIDVDLELIIAVQNFCKQYDINNDIPIFSWRAVEIEYKDY